MEFWLDWKMVKCLEKKIKENLILMMMVLKEIMIKKKIFKMI